MVLLFAMLFSFQVHAADEPHDAETRQAIQLAEQISEDIDNFLRQLEPYRSAVAWSEGFVQIIKTYPFVDFLYLENRFRKIGINAYLLAAPIRFAPEGTCSRSLLGIPAGDLDYYLWVGVNGYDEMIEQMKFFGISSIEENRQNLMKTGLRVKKTSNHWKAVLKVAVVITTHLLYL